jgi:hypothetical protein
MGVMRSQAAALSSLHCYQLIHLSILHRRRQSILLVLKLYTLHLKLFGFCLRFFDSYIDSRFYKSILTSILVILFHIFTTNMAKRHASRSERMEEDLNKSSFNNSKTTSIGHPSMIQGVCRGGRPLKKPLVHPGLTPASPYRVLHSLKRRSQFRSSPRRGMSLRQDLARPHLKWGQQ